MHTFNCVFCCYLIRKQDVLRSHYPTHCLRIKCNYCNFINKLGPINFKIMNRKIYFAVFLTILLGCNKQNKISGALDVPDALFTYTAEGDGRR